MRLTISNSIGKTFLLSSLLFSISAKVSFAQSSSASLNELTSRVATLPPSDLVRDRNGDGRIEIIAFGDSITRGVGDKPPTEEGVYTPFEPREEAGYPLRLETQLGVNVQNLGVPGEFLTTDGINRFISVINSSPADLVIISGGSNDSRLGINQTFYFHSVQKMVNIAEARGVQVLILTPPPECCGHEFFAPLTNGYIEEMRFVAKANNLPIADVSHAFSNTCNLEECELLNLPEGLHPNSIGYDVFGEVILATLYGFDIFTGLGQQEFEQAFGLAPGAVITRPDPTATVTPTPTKL